MIRTNCRPLGKLAKKQWRLFVINCGILCLQESVKVDTITQGNSIHMWGMIRPEMGLAWP